MAERMLPRSFLLYEVPDIETSSFPSFDAEPFPHATNDSPIIATSNIVKHLFIGPSLFLKCALFILVFFDQKQANSFDI